MSTGLMQLFCIIYNLLVGKQSNLILLRTHSGIIKIDEV
jgi:hypothetical protein